VSSRRTKTLLWLSLFPAAFAIWVAMWAMAYSSYLSSSRHASYFLVLHVHRFYLLTAVAVLLLCGLISLAVDRQSAGKK